MPPSLAGDTPRSVCHPGGVGLCIHRACHMSPTPIGAGSGRECLGPSMQGAARGPHRDCTARLVLPSAPGPRALEQAWVWVSAPTGWPGAQTYRRPRVAWRAGGPGYTGAEEATTSRLALFSFLPTVPSVTLVPLWIERLVWDRPAPLAGVSRGGC